MRIVQSAAWFILGVSSVVACALPADELEGSGLRVISPTPKPKRANGDAGASASTTDPTTVNEPDPMVVASTTPTSPPTPSPPPMACTPGAQEVCYSGSPTTLGLGVCRAGKKTCNAAGSAYSACTGETLPATEVCGDGVDNDCDGNIDEGCITTLSVTKAGTGSGVVTSSPAGINCGSTCTGAFPTNTLVTLTAAPSLHDSYAWTGACTGSGTCTVPLSLARSVGVTFTAPPACNGKKVSFTYTQARSFYNPAFTPACTATTIALQASYACAPSLVDMKVNGTIPVAFIGQSAPGSILTAYYSIDWAGAAAPVSGVSLTMAPTTNANCTVSVSLN